MSDNVKSMSPCLNKNCLSFNEVTIESEEGAELDAIWCSEYQKLIGNCGEYCPKYKY